MANIEQLWRDYLEFEKNINPIIAEKMNIERGRDYMNARRVGKELEAETRGLNRHLPSVPPSGLPEEIKQVREIEIWYVLLCVYIMFYYYFLWTYLMHLECV